MAFHLGLELSGGFLAGLSPVDDRFHDQLRSAGPGRRVCPPTRSEPQRGGAGFDRLGHGSGGADIRPDHFITAVSGGFVFRQDRAWF